MDILTFEVDARAGAPALLYADWLGELFIVEQLQLEPIGSERSLGWRDALHVCAMSEMYPHFLESPQKNRSAEFNEGYAEARNWYEENSDRFQIKIRNNHSEK